MTLFQWRYFMDCFPWVPLLSLRHRGIIANYSHGLGCINKITLMHTGLAWIGLNPASTLCFKKPDPCHGFKKINLVAVVPTPSSWLKDFCQRCLSNPRVLDIDLPLLRNISYLSLSQYTPRRIASLASGCPVLKISQQLITSVTSLVAQRHH